MRERFDRSRTRSPQAKPARPLKPARTARVKSIPEAHSEHEAHVVDQIAFRADEPTRVSVLSRVGYADVRSELPADLVPEAQAGVDFG